MNVWRLLLGLLVVCLGLVLTPAPADAQHHRSRARRSRVVRQIPRSPRANRPPRYLNQVRGRGHRAFGGVGNEYLPMVAAAYNRMYGSGQWALWREHIARCAQYHESFVRTANFFQVPVAFVAGIVLHESHCEANARDWAGGRGLAQITYISRAAHVAPLQRILHRPLRFRTMVRRHRQVPYSVEDHLLVAMMHWAYPERTTGWCVNRRGCGILGYNMNPASFARRARQLRRTLGRAPTFAQIAQTLPCIRGPHGRCPREYVARVLAAAFAYQRFMDGVPQTLVQEAGDGARFTRQLLTSNDVPGFDPARDRAFPSVIVPR